MGRNKQDSSRNFRSWNKIISVLRCQASFIALDFFFFQNLKRFDSHYFQLPYEDVLLVSQVVK
jgi:hypothetical protein